MSKDFDQARARVGKALDQALERAREQEAREGVYKFDLSRDRFIIFSDHHKGGRNGADDFLVCERAYNAALAYYYRQGHTLVVLGDVEELWEERRQTVLKQYPHTFQLEGRFHQEGRYLRFFGNHDDDWSHEDLVRRYLVPALGGKPLKVREHLLVRVVDGDTELGSLFLVHGHQGTVASDRIAPISKFFVRYFWRPLQRVVKYSLNTPAKDWQLRQAHDSAMYFWSEQQDKIVLIAGHTHRPVFKSKSHERQIRESLEKAEQALAQSPADQKLREQTALLAAELEWILAQNRQEPGQQPPIELKKPSYFNTGCCAFLDGDITGLEIAEGEIRLIRWPNDEKEPQPKILVSTSLKAVFEVC